jgi:hypothetical protein
MFLAPEKLKGRLRKKSEGKKKDVCTRNSEIKDILGNIYITDLQRILKPIYTRNDMEIDLLWEIMFLQEMVGLRQEHKNVPLCKLCIFQKLKFLRPLWPYRVLSSVATN